MSNNAKYATTKNGKKKGEKGLIKHIHRREYFDFDVQTKYFRELKKYCALINIVHNRLVDIFWINIF